MKMVTFAQNMAPNYGMVKTPAKKILGVGSQMLMERTLPLYDFYFGTFFLGKKDEP